MGGQAEHQIGDNHRIQPAQFFQIGQRFFAAVFAAEPLADGGIESLHADGNARGAGVDAGLGFVHAEIVGQRQILVAGTNQARQVFAVQRGGRAAAEIHRADFAADAALLGFAGHFFDNFININRAVAVFPGIAVEAAEHAVVGAKRDVQIGQRVFVDRLRQILLPDLLPLRLGQRHPAPNRHQRLTLGKSVGRGFGVAPADGLDHGYRQM